MTNPLIVGALIWAGLDATDNSDVVNWNVIESVVDWALEWAGLVAWIWLVSSLFFD
jgi:hypothetical protein